MHEAAEMIWDAFDRSNVRQIDVVLTRQPDGDWAVDWQPTGERYVDGLVLYPGVKRTGFVDDGELTDVPRDQFVTWLEGTREAWPDSIRLVETFLRGEDVSEE